MCRRGRGRRRSVQTQRQATRDGRHHEACVGQGHRRLHVRQFRLQHAEGPIAGSRAACRISLSLGVSTCIAQEAVFKFGKEVSGHE